MTPPRSGGTGPEAGDLLRISRLKSEVGIRVDGEVDLSTVDNLRSALVGLAMVDDGDVHVELGGLHFIDLAGATALVRFAADLGEGRRLLLEHPPSSLRHMIRLLWPHHTHVELSPP